MTHPDVEGLIERLRARGPFTLNNPDGPEAAEVISAQQGRIEGLEGAVREMLRLSDMGLEESLREPEENGNYAAYNRARAVLSPPADEKEKGL